MRRIIVALTAMLFIFNNIKAQHDMTLTERQQSLVAIAAYGAKGNLTKLGEEIDKGLDAGLTANEVKEALSHMYAYAGFPRSLNALGTLQKVLAERSKNGRTYEAGRDSDPLPENFDALKAGTEIQTKLSGRAFNYDFAPATDYYLKAHLFGDIFARNTLTHAERELVTLGIISTLPGCESQLGSHAIGALNMGVKREELRDVPAVLETRIGIAEACRARDAVSAALGEKTDTEYSYSETDFPKGNPNTAYAKYFTGNSYLAPLANGGGKLPVSNVTFEPRCRNNWHIHHKGGQILICVSGRGWYQEWGKSARELHPGDVVDIPSETKHWHGAARDSWFQHIAISVPSENGSTTWLEEVSDDDYDKLK